MEKNNKLIAFIRPVTIGKHTLSTGTYNGYVALSPNHRFYWYDCDSIPVRVHGGLTLGCNGSDFPKTWFDSIEILTRGVTEIPKDYYVVGFDTCHYGDTPENWNRGAVIRETLLLKKQLLLLGS